MDLKRPSFLPKSWDLPTSILRRLGDAAGRQRLMDEEGHLLFILHQPPKPEDDEVRTPLLIWGNPQGEWRSTPEAGGLSALGAHLDRYRTAIHALDHAVESANTPRQYFEVMRHVHPLQRSTRNLFAVLQEAREARAEERRFINFRDQAGDLERAIDLISGDAKAGMEFSLAENTEEQSRFAHEATLEARKLNRFVAFFFPLATLVAIFGMNPPYEVMKLPGFLPVIATGLLAGFLIRGILGRRA